MTFAYKSSAGFLSNHVARLFASGLNARLKDMALSTGVFPVLLLLWDEDAVTQSSLVQRLSIEQATLANTLKRMVRDGLVARRPHPEDGRQSLIHLTDKARQLEPLAKAAAKAQNEWAMRYMSVDEKRHYLALCSKLIAAMKPD